MLVMAKQNLPICCPVRDQAEQLCSASPLGALGQWTWNRCSASVPLLVWAVPAPSLSKTEYLKLTCAQWLTRNTPYADAEVATIPFMHRYNVALAHFQSVKISDIVAENGLHRFDKWLKVRLLCFAPHMIWKQHLLDHAWQCPVTVALDWQAGRFSTL